MPIYDIPPWSSKLKYSILTYNHDSQFLEKVKLTARKPSVLPWNLAVLLRFFELTGTGSYFLNNQWATPHGYIDVYVRIDSNIGGSCKVIPQIRGLGKGGSQVRPCILEILNNPWVLPAVKYEAKVFIT